MLLDLLRSLIPEIVSIAHFAVIGYGVSIAVGGSISLLRYRESLCEQEQPEIDHGAEPGGDDRGSGVHNSAAGYSAADNHIPVSSDCAERDATVTLPHIDPHPTVDTATAPSGPATEQLDTEPAIEQPAKPKQQRAAKRRPVDHS